MKHNPKLLKILAVISVIILLLSFTIVLSVQKHPENSLFLEYRFDFFIFGVYTHMYIFDSGFVVVRTRSVDNLTTVENNVTTQLSFDEKMQINQDLHDMDIFSLASNYEAPSNVQTEHRVKIYFRSLTGKSSIFIEENSAQEYMPDNLINIENYLYDLSNSLIE